MFVFELEFLIVQFFQNKTIFLLIGVYCLELKTIDLAMGPDRLKLYFTNAIVKDIKVSE